MKEIITKNEFESLFINKGIDAFEGIKETPDKHFSLVEGKYNDFVDITMLSFCSGIGNYTCVREMLELGASPNEVADGYRQKYTPLHMVIYKANGIAELEERKKIMSALIEKDADMHHKGNGGYSWPPLAVADWLFSSETPALGEHLIRYGVDWRIYGSAESSKAAATNDNNPAVTSIRYLLSASESFRLFACNEALKVLSTSECTLSSKLAESTITSLKNVIVSYNDGDLSVMGDNDYKFNCTHLFKKTDTDDVLKHKAKLLKGLDYADVQAKIFGNCEVTDDLLQSKIDDVSSVTVNLAEETIAANSCAENTESLNDTFFSSMTKLICEYTSFFC